MQISYFDISLNSVQKSQIKRFRTFPDNPEQETDFNVIFGGSISNSDLVTEMHKIAAKTNPYAVFLGGDIVYDSGFQE